METITRLDLTVAERDALTTAWGVVCSLLIKDANTATLALRILRSDKHSDAVTSLTKKLGQIQEDQISEALDRIRENLGDEIADALDDLRPASA